ncbi:hypothetical protein ASE61_15145 [Bosea sp. Root670]|uniref:DUF7940 domain-containing protein n=1 Tax=Bosea sp. Root670 TaxID=1736583 RepID=UPI0007160FBA|nr:hypothetical protein [Bosea sp. Root670]KRE02611.1 hypothetical protein ASE61_15145 [Bosea sp. Root670]
MEPVPNWRRVLRYAWSIKLIVLGGVLSGAEVALPLIREVVDVPRGWFAAASLIVTAGAFIARLVAQKSISGGDDGE